jgi:hypothetical protein
MLLNLLLIAATMAQPAVTQSVPTVECRVNGLVVAEAGQHKTFHAARQGYRVEISVTWAIDKK